MIIEFDKKTGEIAISNHEGKVMRGILGKEAFANIDVLDQIYDNLSFLQEVAEETNFSFRDILKDYIEEMKL